MGDLPLLPYTAMVTSCFVWIIYGVLKREPIIWVTNIVEFILSVYYFVEFTVRVAFELELGIGMGVLGLGLSD